MRHRPPLFDERPAQLDAVLLENAGQGLGVVRADGCLLRANRRLADLLGAPGAELADGILWDFTGWEACGIAAEGVRIAIDGAAAGRPFRLAGHQRGPARREDGIAFLFAPVAVELAPVPLIMVSEEVQATGGRTDERRDAASVEGAERDARRRLSEVEQILRHAPIGLGLIDRDLRFVHVNERLAEINGMPAADHVGRTVWDVLPGLADAFEALYQPVIERGERAIGLGLRGTTATSENERYWTLDLHPFRCETGEIAGVIAVVVETTELVAAESARMERERELSAFFDSAPVGLFVLDRHQRFTRVNEPLVRIHGIPASAHLGQPIGALCPPLAEPVDLIYRQFDERSQAPDTFEFSGECRSESGLLQHWTATCFAVTGQGGAPIGLGGMVVDVTAKLRTEEELRRRTDELSKAQRLAKLSYWALSVDSGKVRWSRDVADLTGRPPDRMPDSYAGHQAILTRESWARADAAVRDAIRTGMPYQIDLEMIHADGHHVWITTLGEPERDSGGHVVTVRGVTQDITARKAVELALRDSEQRFQQAFVHAPIGMKILTTRGRIIRANPALCRMLGYTEAELQGMTLYSLAPREDVERRLELFSQLVIGDIGAYAFEERMSHKDGRTLWVLAHRTLVRCEDGSAPYVISQTLDITGRKQATARILRLSELYAAISETNKAILHCPNPEEVYRAVCRTCVEHAGFRLAWIGIADPSTGRIVPVASAGPQPALLDSLVVGTDADGPEARSPAGRAFRSQRVSMRVGSATESVDLQAGNRDSPVRTISIPLRKGGEPFGTFTVDGGDDEFFDDDVLQLLQEMADSISFALDLFDREQVRKQTDVALRDSERRLREAQAISNTGDWELNRDTGAMVWSPQLFKLFERPVSLGPPDVNEALAYYSAESLELTRERFWHAIDTGERCEIEQTLQLRSGALRYHFTVIVPVKDASGRVVRLCGTVQDVTERKLAEQELLRKTAEIEDLYQNAPCGYHSIGADGRFLRINDTELHWLGYTRDEVIGRMCFCDVLTPESDALFRRNFPVFRATGVLRNVEFELRCRDGSTLPVLASSTADFDVDGSFVSSRTILSNISDRKRLEQERIAYLTRLADLSRHLVEVQEMERRKLAGELHDRASPNLAALQLTIGNLADRLPAPVVCEVEPLLDDAQALLSATSADIREICNELRPPALDYAGLGAALQTYAEQFSRRAGVAVEVDLSDFNTILPPDIQSLLFRIVQEALTNCSKHARAGTIRIRLEDSDDELSLVIADDGVGFDPASLSETTANPGLGLITMKERAELAGGTFSIDAHPGEGTLIRVSFGHSAGWLAPLDEQAAALPERRSASGH